ncbi:hypothetical protein ABZY19_05880 [Streptomyces sp. NPDC006475]|uniref:hypothetical protein n=1 Tax=Streptomyces sp. NPDC006475 TaxID=3155719 RepID=UPI0033BB5B7F
MQDLDKAAASAPGAGRLRTHEEIRTRLVAQGQALDDGDVPVTVRWRALDYVHEEPAYGDLDDSSLQAGHAGENGLRHVLAPFYRERIRF